MATTALNPALGTSLGAAGASGASGASGDFLSKLASSSSAAAAAATAPGGAGDMSERFLKLLVTQMQNQDPLNPLDNAQVTTQMAQINTVSGIEKLNQSVGGLSTILSEKLGALSIGSSLDALNGTLQTLQGQMLQSQTLQGASLVGRTVLLPGSQLALQEGRGIGAYELSGPADRVVVEVLGPAGQVLDSVDLGAQPTGRGGFTWTPPAGVPANAAAGFRVKAASGAAAVSVQPLMADTVSAISAGPSGLVLELARTGATPFNQVKAVS